MSTFLVVVDANVLVPAVLCDFILRAAGADMYRLVWTEDILDEVRRTLIIDLGKSVAQADRRIAAMKSTFPEALITQHTQLIPAMTNDPQDRHVQAAAVASGSQVIVTSNISDFPAESLAPFSIEVQAPDQFLTDLLDLDYEQVSNILGQQARALRNPPKTVYDLLNDLARLAPNFVGQLHF